MTTVELTDLSKSYPEGKKVTTVVHGIDLKIHGGEFMVLVGPSGCGKSTTLRMIAGLEEITDGSISIEGKVVNDVLPKDRDIAMVFQNYALYPHMTVFENMAFGLKLRGFPRAEIEERVREAAAILNLSDYLQRKPKALSGGQRQRVALGRAIVRKPKVFLFDEPLSNLDAKMRVATRAEITKLHRRLGATMIYVTHDQVEAMTMGDRICVMKDGRIMQVAKPLDLYLRPANLFVAGFIGSPAMNLISGDLGMNGEQVEFTETGSATKPLRVTLPAALSLRSKNLVGRSVVLGIRPENIAPDESAVSHSATVEVCEPMGAETFCHLNTGAHVLVAKFQADVAVSIGQKVNFSLNPAALHLFDRETEQSI